MLSSIDYSVRGEGQPLVLLHGLFGSRENLGAIAKDLSEHFCVYSLDLPGHGRSAHVDDLSLDAMATEVLHWMAHVNLSRAHFFGHSLGGKVAMEVALRAPEHVQSLVVADIAPVAYEHRHTGVFQGLTAIDLDTLQSRVEADQVLAATVPEKPVRSFLLKNLQKKEDGGFRWRMHLDVIHAQYPEMIAANSEARFDAPVLFLKAENSDYIKSEYREAIMSRFPQAQLRVVANTGHWLHAEKPELIASLVRRFLSAA